MKFKCKHERKEVEFIWENGNGIYTTQEIECKHCGKLGVSTFYNLDDCGVDEDIEWKR